MDEDDDKQWLDSGLAETLSDLELSLPANDLHIIVSRIKDTDGSYYTKVWLNRKVRKLYALGLLTEALSMCNQTGSEFIWTPETPSILEEETEEDAVEDEGDEDEDDGTAGSLVKI